MGKIRELFMDLEEYEGEKRCVCNIMVIYWDGEYSFIIAFNISHFFEETDVTREGDAFGVFV